VRFADAFEDRLVRQGDHENRSIEESLQIGWTLLSMLPKSELKRIRADHIEAYYQGASGVAEA
jgi:V/A-type H+-transporting ATPase subunit B